MVVTQRGVLHPFHQQPLHGRTPLGVQANRRMKRGAAWFLNWRAASGVRSASSMNRRHCRSPRFSGQLPEGGDLRVDEWVAVAQAEGAQPAAGQRHLRLLAHLRASFARTRASASDSRTRSALFSASSARRSAWMAK